MWAMSLPRQKHEGPILHKKLIQCINLPKVVTLGSELFGHVMEVGCNTKCMQSRVASIGAAPEPTAVGEVTTVSKVTAKAR